MVLSTGNAVHFIDFVANEYVGLADLHFETRELLSRQTQKCSIFELVPCTFGTFF